MMVDRVNNVESRIYISSELETLFREVDVNRNGYVSNAELRDFLAANRRDLPRHVFDVIYERADRNGDGRLDVCEFAGLISDPAYRPLFRDVCSACVKRYASFVLPRHWKSGRKEYAELLKCWPPPLTMMVISIVQIFLFAADARNGHIDAKGFLARQLIFDPAKRNETWRYATYMFVHDGYTHLSMNLIVQLFLGVILEAYHQWWRITLIYMAGVLTGSLGNFVFDSIHQVAGASGGVYSLITAHVATVVLNWKEMRFPLSILVVFLAFAVGDTIYVFCGHDSRVGYIVHLCGGVAGLLVGILILKNVMLHKFERILQFICLILYVGFIGIAIVWNVVIV